MVQEHQTGRLCETLRDARPSVVLVQIGEEFERGFVLEASQSGAVVGIDEVLQEPGALCVAGEAGSVSAVVVQLRPGFHGVAEPSVESLGHAVGLGAVGAAQFVANAMISTDAVKGVAPGGPCGVARLGTAAEAVGELATPRHRARTGGAFGGSIGKPGVDRVAEGLQEAGPGGRHGVGTPVGKNLDMGKAGVARDGHEGIFALALQLGKVAQIDVNYAEGGLLEHAGPNCG